MEPIDRRITAAQLLALRSESDAQNTIARLLGVADMPPGQAMQTKQEISAFIASGDATAASQLIHAAALRHLPNSRNRTP